MFKKKRNLIFASCLVGLLATTTATTLALSSCKTNSSPSKPDTPTNPDTPSTPDTPAKPDEAPYTGVIDWNDKNIVDNLITDDSGLVYSDNTKTIVIAVKPEVTSSTIKIPSKVKSIMGYTRVMYKTSDGVIHENIPTGNVSYSKVNQLYGAFENMKTLTSITLESGSQLENIGKLAFLNCTALKSIQGTTTSNLKYIGVNSFSNCTNLQTISTSNVTRIDDNAFSNCTSLSSIDLSNTLTIGNGTFHNCTNLETLGSLAKLKTIDKEAFYNATKSGASITLKLSSLTAVADSAFSGAKGISTIDFSNNASLTSIVDNAFINSSITSVDFSGCSNLSSINQRAFENCTNLTTVYLPANDATNLTSIGWNAFAKCGNLTTIAPKGSTASFIATNKLSSLGTNALANTAITSVDLSSFAISSSNSSSAPLGSETSLAFIPNLTSIKLPNSITTLNAGLFYGSGTKSVGFSLDLPSSITNIIYSTSTSILDANSNDTSTKINVPNATPFTNSGITSIDMSKITSYQLADNNINSVPSYLFYGATKLTSVILKNTTTAIGSHAFQGTTALTSITYPNSSNTISDSNAIVGFKASSNISTIGTDAFNGAFSANSNAIVDLSATKMTSAPIAFNSSNVTSLVLPSTITTIPANSFDNMSKLTTFNFGELKDLKQIVAPNFNNTQLTSIDLSNVQNPSTLFSEQSENNKLFTNLPSNCVVSLPNANWDFKGAFVDKTSNLVLLSYPKGISFGNLSSDGVFSFSSGNDDKITKIKDIDMSNNEAIMSIGSNTFFGSANLNSITLNAKGISGGTATTKGIGLFSSSTSNITANTSNTKEPTQYTKTILPFGNNTKLTSLNYVGFTLDTNAVAGSTNIETLFKKTNQVTWAEISKIINSLSYQSTEAAGAAAGVTPNMTNWVATSGGSKTMNSDITNYWNDRDNVKNMVLTNLYNGASDTTGNAKSFNGATTQMTFMHNGATWVYTNDGTTIKLTGTVNMYRLTNGTNQNYLTYFNQITYSSTGSNTYYIPGDSINVTLTVATASNSTTK